MYTHSELFFAYKLGVTLFETKMFLA